MSTINLDHIVKGLSIEIYPLIADTFSFVLDANENNEAEYQIKEGCFYQYKFNLPGYRLKADSVVEVSAFNVSEGRISPNYYVGTLILPVFKHDNKCGTLNLEVQSVKTTYRKDYRFMLESITEHAADLILQTNSPVNNSLEVDYNADPKTLYQQFCFVKSIIDTEDFEIAIQQILNSPTTTWETIIESKDVRSLKKIKNKDIRSLIHSPNRTSINNVKLNSIGVNSIALKIPSWKKKESIDTPENRFVKYVLEAFDFFCEEIKLHCNQQSRLYEEAHSTHSKIESFLQHGIFREISKPLSLKLNSPVLQKKAGYREVLKAWLMYNLAGKLSWVGGEDVYQAGSKNVAKLYEYWLFFKLLEVIKVCFTIESDEYKKLISYTDDTLGLKLKEGKQIALRGSYSADERELSILFSYNKTFSGGKPLSKEGTWTLQMDPDYTLSVWPNEIEEKEAEKTEQIVHIHFDAKYKVKNKETNSDFKRDDIIKMHAYKDAIRRTAGAYILYPGINDKPKRFEGFHEVLPGLGAFAIRPSSEDSGINYLIDFVNEVKTHFLNRTTQREKLSSKTYLVTKEKPIEGLHEPIPEYLNGMKLIPDETFVLVGYCNDDTKYEWYKKTGFYNFRMNDDKGSLELTSEVSNSKYLLLRRKGEVFAEEIYEIVSKGPKVFSKEKMNSLGYPNPKQDYYLVIEFKEIDLSIFGNSVWKFKELQGYKNIQETETDLYKLPGIPFTTTLSELMSKKKK
jgi:predicted component of viral defense system (DUF524 family)